ncbi:MAG TPA: hypothetical protein VME46_22930 [Acidimicrobiales bacterium]|nr:hypothetical protein [Acidimicrobiales bacterium]
MALARQGRAGRQGRLLPTTRASPLTSSDSLVPTGGIGAAPRRHRTVLSSVDLTYTTKGISAGFNCRQALVAADLRL